VKIEVATLNKIAMNIIEAKKAQIVDYLKANGHTPIRIKYGRALYLSPMRIETIPSFNVYLDKNQWYDYGSGEGGDLINLVMKLSNVNFFEAVEIISRNIISQRPIVPYFKIENLLRNQVISKLIVYRH